MKCNFCNNIADANLKYNDQSVPACMNCIDKKLELNLERIDNKNNRLLEAINIIRREVV